MDHNPTGMIPKKDHLARALRAHVDTTGDEPGSIHLVPHNSKVTLARVAPQSHQGAINLGI
jgi:hypothetical protein